MKHIKLFVSYSWDTEEHKNWVRKLAEDLDSFEQLHVTWDGFDLDELSDKNEFMERGIHDADYVLIITTQKYRQKSEERTSGVGIETYMAAAHHWDQLLSGGQSNIIVLQREKDSVPRYLKGKIYIDFSDDKKYQAALSRLLSILSDEAKVPRPAKTLTLDAGIRTYTFTRVEDVIRINNKNRRQIVGPEEGTDFSGTNRIKFELWEAKSPTSSYFLALGSNITISQTIARASSSLRENGIRLSHLTVLRPTKGEKGLIEQQFEANGIRVKIHEFTYPEYIWEFCIDDELKRVQPSIRVPNYTDQAVRQNTGGAAETIKESAREYFGSVLSSRPTPTAHVVVAPGGMGKTSLCLAVQSDLLSKEDSDASVILIRAESLRTYFSAYGLVNVQIASVYDLYEFYAKSQGYARIYDATTFDLAVLCGNLIVIIDGLDELVSVLQERLQLDELLESIEQLHDELGSSQILITTRNGLLIDDGRLSELGMVRHELLGFDAANCARYARRRFAKFSSASALEQKLEKQLSSVSLRDESGRIIPFFLDIVATILEEELQEDRDGEFVLAYEETPYCSNNNLVDHIVFSVMRREELRHGLGISVPQVVLLLSEIIADYGERFPYAELYDRLKLLYDDRASDLLAKIVLNPLIIRSAGDLHLRYAFLADYFPVLFLLDSIVQKSETQSFVSCLARLGGTDTPQFRELKRYFSSRPDDFFQCTKGLINALRPRALAIQESGPREQCRRAISALIRLSVAINGLSGGRLTEHLLDLYGVDRGAATPTIDGLFMYGEFPPMDFSGLRIQNSRFVGFSRFPQCRFASAKFLFTSIAGCGGVDNADKSLRAECFDTSCDIGDLAATLQFVADGKQAEDAKVERDVKKFFHCFFQGDRFVNVKTVHMKFSTRLSGLTLEKFDRLVAKGFFQENHRTVDDLYYGVSDALKPSIYRFLINNYADRSIRRFIKLVR